MELDRIQISTGGSLILHNNFKESKLAAPDSIASFKIANGQKKPEIFVEKNLIVTSGEKFTLISPTSGLINESKYMMPNDRWVSFFLRNKSIKQLRGRVIVAGNGGYQSYYHWLYQIILSIIFIRSSTPEYQNLKILGPPLNSWRRRFLEFLNIENYIEADPFSAYTVEEAVFSNISWGGFSYRPCDELLNAAESIIKPSTNRKQGRIYISRQDTPKRGILNETELTSFLNRMGFTIIVLSDVLPSEQISAFNNADVVLGAHGAGLTNLIFSKSSAKIIELLPEDYLNPCFYCLAIKKGMSYTGVVNSVKRDGLTYHDSKQTIDITNLSQTFKELGIEQ